MADDRDSQDLLKSVSKEEFDTLPVRSREEIELSLAEGKADRRRVEQKLRPPSVDPRLRFRG